MRALAPRALILVCACVVFSGRAWADAGATQVTTEALAALDALFLEFERGLNLFSAGAPFLDLGKRIAIVLFGVVFAWGIVRNMVLGKSFVQLGADMIQPVVLLGIILFGIDNGFGQVIRDSIYSLADRLATTAGLPGIAGLELSMMKAFAQTGFKIMDLDIFSSTTGSSTGTWSWSSWWQTVQNVSGAAVAYILGWVARLVAGVLLLVAGAAGAGIVLVSKVAVALGMLMAPVMMPWGIWQPTEFLLSSWIRFVVTGGLGVLVATAVGGMLMNAAAGIVAISTKFASNSTSIALSCVLILFSVLAIFLMLQVPKLASGLVSGDASLGLRGWSAPASAALGVARAGATAVGSAAAGVGGAGVAAATGAFAAVRAVQAVKSGAGALAAARAGVAAYKRAQPKAAAKSLSQILKKP